MDLKKLEVETIFSDRIEKLVEATGLDAPPGSKKKGFLNVEGFSPEVDVPLFLIRGKNPGPIVVIVAGIHGGEHNSIEAARRVGSDLDPDEVSGAVAIVPVANRPAFHARTHNGSPPDGQNMGRLFPGDSEGTALERAAYEISSRLIVYADTVMDLHGADGLEMIIPHLYIPEHNENNEEKRNWGPWDLAEAYGIEISGYTGPRVGGGSAVHYGASLGIPSILAEAGSGFLEEEGIGIHYRGMMNVLRRIGVLEGLPLIERQIRNVKYEKIRSPMTGFFYSFAEVGQFVNKGQVIGKITDYFGDETTEIIAPVSGEIDFIKLTMATNKDNGLFAIVVDI